MTLDFYLGVLCGVGLCLIAWWGHDRVRSRHLRMSERGGHDDAHE